MSIKVIGNEFQISKDTYGIIYAELCSNRFPYAEKCKQKIEVLEVLQMLQKDDNYSIAAIIVKKELIMLMYKKLKFGVQELLALRELFRIWREPIITRREP